MVPVPSTPRLPLVGLLLVVLVLASAAWGIAPHRSGSDATTDGAAHGDEHRYVGPGPVHFPAGHVVPVSGIGVLAVVDDTFDPIGGYVCQSAPGADACGPSHPSLTGRVFCDGITLYAHNGWDPAKDLWVWLGSPFDTIGVGHGVTCEKPRPATTGYVFHWGPA